MLSLLQDEFSDLFGFKNYMCQFLKLCLNFILISL